MTTTDTTTDTLNRIEIACSEYEQLKSDNAALTAEVERLTAYIAKVDDWNARAMKAEARVKTVEKTADDTFVLWNEQLQRAKKLEAKVKELTAAERERTDGLLESIEEAEKLEASNKTLRLLVGRGKLHVSNSLNRICGDGSCDDCAKARQWLRDADAAMKQEDSK